MLYTRMTLPPKDYIAARRRELSSQIQQLKDELAALDRMESALTGQQSIFSQPPARPPSPPVNVIVIPEDAQPKRQRFQTSIKEMVLHILGKQFEAIPALMILDEIEEVYKVKVDRTSLSPQLSRLKEGDYVIQSHGGWEITQKGLDELNQMTGLKKAQILNPQTPGKE
jgi:hypothetical protein